MSGDMRKLTDNQMFVLRFVNQMRGGITKERMAGTDWRALDSLERRGLLNRRENGRYFVTETGANLLAEPAVSTCERSRGQG